MDAFTVLLDIAEKHCPEFAEKRRIVERDGRIAVGGDYNYIASVASLERAERNAVIRGLLDSGLNSEEVARRVGLTGQAVRKIRASA
ncbi:MAG TPA: hypothetical protein PLI17_03905 [Denitromonas sp.]|uniref:hypothetical protein n=1 Tax=Denitromonas sp. TaxID=2734609 RepID=UPI001D9F3DB0|nr:hypothetical protein [Rhizobiaceae bacterium]HPR05758.1 hypothetical protein [Denitromonas sp.]